MKKILLFVSILSFLIGCSSPQNETGDGREVTVSGMVGFPGPTGVITIQKIRTDDTVVDTIELSDDYTFEKKIRLIEPGYYQFNFYNRQFVNVILDKSDVMVNVDGNSATGFVEVKGSPDMDLVDRVRSVVQNTQNTPEVQQLVQEYQLATMAGDQTRMDEIVMRNTELINEGYDSVANILRDEPASLALINLLMSNQVPVDNYLDVYISAAEKTKVAYPDASFTKDLVDYVEKAKVTAVGQVAPEIALPNPDGDVVALSSLRGKYVLVDFWAKWCGPCRQENPNVVRAYNKYNAKGFEVFGVSLDRTRADWVQAIKEDGLIWTHVSDLQYFNSQAAADYNINAIPFSILVDPDGVIIGKNLRGPQLQEKLEEIFTN